MGLGTGFTGAEELAWQAWARPVGMLGGQERTLQLGRPCLRPVLSPWHSQVPTACQTSGQALSHTTWGSQNAAILGGGEAEVPAQVPSVSCPRSWGWPPAGSSEQSTRFLGEGGRLAGLLASSGVAPGTQLEPGRKAVVPQAGRCQEGGRQLGACL